MDYPVPTFEQMVAGGMSEDDARLLAADAEFVAAHPPALTLAGYLLARIAEDEAWATESGRAYLYVHGPAAIMDEPQTPGFYARVLAECEAKRRIVERFQETAPPFDSADQQVEHEQMELYVLPALVQPYADHPDFRDEWRL